MPGATLPFQALIAEMSSDIFKYLLGAKSPPVKDHYLWMRFRIPYSSRGASLLSQTVKTLPAMWETWVPSLDGEDPLKKRMATHSSILAWRIPWTEEPGSYSPCCHQSRTWLSNSHTHTHTHTYTHSSRTLWKGKLTSPHPPRNPHSHGHCWLLVLFLLLLPAPS